MRYFEPSREKLLKCGVVTVDSDDKVLKMTEKSSAPETNWCCPPFYYYTRDDLKLVKTALESGCKKDAPGSFAAWLCEKSDVYAMEMPGKRYDIGTLESYEYVQKVFDPNVISK
jgi:glucose-1-phosphate thymidylyltransferase